MQQHTGSQRRDQVIAGVKFLAPIALSLLSGRYPKVSTFGRVGLGVLEATTGKEEVVSDTSHQPKI